jgi:hypothetical protein
MSTWPPRGLRDAVGSQCRRDGGAAERGWLVCPPGGAAEASRAAPGIRRGSCIAAATGAAGAVAGEADRSAAVFNQPSGVLAGTGARPRAATPVAGRVGVPARAACCACDAHREARHGSGSPVHSMLLQRCGRVGCRRWACATSRASRHSRGSVTPSGTGVSPDGRGGRWRTGAGLSTAWVEGGHHPGAPPGVFHTPPSPTRVMTTPIDARLRLKVKSCLRRPGSYRPHPRGRGRLR